MGGKKPLRRPLWPPTRATASNYYPLGLDGAGGAAKPLLRAPKKPAPLHGRLPAFSGAVDAFERARKCFLEWRYFFSIILSEFLKNRVALHKDTGETTQPPELKYVEVLAATQSSGADKEYQAPVENEEEENPEETLPATITLLVNSEQAQLLAHLEESNSLHLAFVYRGARANAEKFLAAQDAFFAEPEVEAGGESSQPEAPVDAADGGQSTEGTEEQEVESADGE